MNIEIINPIPVELDSRKIVRRMKLKKENENRKVDRLLKAGQPMIKARAVFKVAYIDRKFKRSVEIDGTMFTSSVLRKNLDEVERVFPFVVTIGARLEKEARKNHDLMEQFYLDAIGNAALNKTREFLIDHLQSKFALNRMSHMSPGSLQDWPLEEQKPLFSVIGDVESAIGVTLTNHLLMLPTKSVSGILFPTEVPFFSCQLCPRQKCSGRKAAYDQKLFAEYGFEE